MLFFLCFMVASLIIGVLTFHRINIPDRWGKIVSRREWAAVSLFPIYSWVVISIVSLSGSYANYLDIRSFHDGVIVQYKDAVEMYGDKAVISVSKAYALTDFGHQGYQAAMADFVRDLRKSVADYNRTYVKKNLLAKNPFFNWYIITPDEDMKLLSMTDK